MKVTNNSVQGADAASVQSAHAAKAGKAGAKDGVEKSKTSSVEIEGDSRPEISNRGRELAQAKQVASSAPDVREDKIAQLKARIAEGKYHVDAKAVADRMVDEHLSTNIG